MYNLHSIIADLYQEQHGAETQLNIFLKETCRPHQRLSYADLLINSTANKFGGKTTKGHFRRVFPSTGRLSRIY